MFNVLARMLTKIIFITDFLMPSTCQAEILLDFFRYALEVACS